MDKCVLTDIMEYIYSYNRIPIWLIGKEGMEYHSLRSEVLRSDALEFFKVFSPNKPDIRLFNDMEYYASVPVDIANQRYRLVLGPGFCAHPINIGYKGVLTFDYLVKSEKLKELLLVIPTVSGDEFLRYLKILMSIIGGQDVSDVEVRKTNELTLTNLLNRRLTEYIFQVRENEMTPYSPEVERRIMDMVKTGDVEGVKDISVKFSTDSPGLQPKYLFKIVALVTVATRAVLECGVDSEEAYGLSDLYLNNLSNTKNDYQVYEIAKNILPHFAGLAAKRLNKNKREDYSPYLHRAEKYVKTHLHYPLSLDNVAGELGINPKYLSRLFVTCKGEKFTHYVNRQRVKEAKELLASTDYPIIDIANSLSFSSESYFIKVFSQTEGITPQKYRNKSKVYTAKESK